MMEDPRCLPPGWNAMEFVIGNKGDNNVDSWAYLRGGWWGGGGGGGGQTTTATGGGRE